MCAYVSVCVCILCCQWFECTQSRLGRVKGSGQGGAVKGFGDNPWIQGEGERVFVWID